MLVKITEYCPAKGRGSYERVDDGKRFSFSYTMFLHQRMIPVGSFAEVKAGVLVPARVSLWRRFVLWAKTIIAKEVL